MAIPTEKELLEFISNNDLVNFSRIANHFDVRIHIIPDIIKPLLKAKKVRLEKIGSNKFVRMSK